jgi:hypothetical protein
MSISNFLVAASRTEKKLVADRLFLVHLSEGPFQFLIGVWHCGFFLDSGHLVPGDSGRDPVLLEQEENDVQVVAGF